jgi:alkyl sulfatase BDS1-like metallo-beta-lactamase superfamily hydrolase
VPRYLSDEWLAALDEAASASESLRSVTEGVHLTIEHIIVDGRDDGGELRYHVELDDGHVSFRPGPGAQATVTFREDRATATAVARGELAAQAAFLAGDLSIGGDLSALVEHAAVLAGIDGALDRVRSATTY